MSIQSQTGKTAAAADKWVTLAGTGASLTASAGKRLLAAAGGAHLKIEGGNIELHAPGRVEFKASMKDWTGPASIRAKHSLPEASPFPNSICVPCMLKAAQAGSPFAAKA